MSLPLPKIAKLLLDVNGNEIWQYFDVGPVLNNAQTVSVNPFVVESEGTKYLLTRDKDYSDDEGYQYVILTSKKPTRRDLNNGKLKLKRWLKHPSFQTKTPEEIVSSWTEKFRPIKENEAKGVKGLRPPQIGALYSILAHLENQDEKAIVVMPTGTGKTETMLATLLASCCDRLLISVPSDSLRTQISEKFITLGLLKEFGLVDSSCLNPKVGIIRHGFADPESLQDFILRCNVVVSTMGLLTALSNSQKTILNDSFSHFFVDEAHHSEAETWKELIDKFDSRKVILFTATPFRNDGKNLQGKLIFNFSLRRAQEQRYYKTINYLPIREYNRELADEKIAEKAVQQLKADIAAGNNHILMV